MHLQLLAAVLTFTQPVPAPLAQPILAAPSAAPAAVLGEGWIADFDEAVALAKKEKKDLLVDFTGSDWCGWCIKLNDEVFKHEEFLVEAKKHFVLVALDFPRKPEIKAKVPNPKRNEELQEKYQIQGFPTILLMTPDGDVFGQTGYRPGGPKPYVEHMMEMLNKGKAEIADAAKLVDAWKGATGDAKLAAWDKLADALEKMSDESVAARKLLEPIKEGLTLDPTNAAGRKLRAVKALLRFDMADEAVVTAGMELDPKNEAGTYELALAAAFQDQSRFDDADYVKGLIEKVEKFDALKQIHNRERVVFPFALCAFLSRDTLQDMERAKRFAARTKEIGSDNTRLIAAMDEILNG